MQGANMQGANMQGANMHLIARVCPCKQDEVHERVADVATKGEVSPHTEANYKEPLIKLKNGETRRRQR
jgi:hypothetical protein